MSDYKHYFLRQLGIKESQFKPSDFQDEYPNIDPEELAKGAGEEAKEHGMPPEKAVNTAVQHLEEPRHKKYYSGLDAADKNGILNRGRLQDMMFSPTAIPTPVIGVSVKGSSTGGLPSGADQGKDISPKNLGGYEKIPIQTLNSKVVDKTPSNADIGSTGPISKNVATDKADEHPHQIQKDAGEVPQAVTGASSDADDDNGNLSLKSAMPKGIDIDVPDASGTGDVNQELPTNNPDEEEEEDEKEETPFGMNETFERHKKLAFAKIDENVGAKEPFCTTWKMDPEKAGMVKTGTTNVAEVKEEEEPKEANTVTEVKYSAPFERMRGMAGLGKVSLGSNGIWENAIPVNELKPETYSKIKDTGIARRDQRGIEMAAKAEHLLFRKFIGMPVQGIGNGSSQRFSGTIKNILIPPGKQDIIRIEIIPAPGATNVLFLTDHVIHNYILPPAVAKLFALIIKRAKDAGHITDGSQLAMYVNPTKFKQLSKSTNPGKEPTSSPAVEAGHEPR